MITNFTLAYTLLGVGLAGLVAALVVAAARGNHVDLSALDEPVAAVPATAVDDARDAA